MLSAAGERSNRDYFETVANNHLQSARHVIERMSAECFSDFERKADAYIARWNTAMREIAADQQRQIRNP